VSRIQQKVSDFQRTVETIAEAKGIDPTFVAWGISLSDRSEREWDMYTRRRYGVAVHEDEDYYRDASQDPDEDEEEGEEE